MTSLSGETFLPAAPVLVAGWRDAVWLATDGAVETLTHGQTRRRLADALPLVCHIPGVVRRLKAKPFRALDVLELFAFVRPARFCAPTERGLAAAAGLDMPTDPAALALSLREAAATFLAELGSAHFTDRENAAAIAARMAERGWPWAGAVLRALGVAPGSRGLDVWNRLPEWVDAPVPPPPDQWPVEAGEARARLAALLGANAEARPEQADYASAAALAFAPIEKEGEPKVVIAEAGTGVGKTLGYIAPASVWIDKNDGAVWLSTYTKNLQRQIDGELDRLYPDPAIKARKVVVRKGRENYLCLLNLEEAAGRGGGPAIPGLEGAGLESPNAGLGLMARWAGASRDGDMIGGDFPGWLVGLVGRANTLGLTDRRGECIYSACTHYRKCFIERATRRARRAEIVIANHALVMVLAARGEDGLDQPTRYVFDEGHHLFEAADGAFSAHLTGREARELRRWLLGIEAGQRGRARGLKRRAGDLAEGDEAAATALAAVLDAAHVLPAEGWLRRAAERQPLGPAEAFLSHVHQQVAARAPRGGAYGSETVARPAVEGLLEAAAALGAVLARLAAPMLDLEKALAKRLDAEADTLESGVRLRIESTIRALSRRRREVVCAWRDMLADLPEPQPATFMDWFAIDRADRREIDVGMHRHWIDPARPFAETVLLRCHGALITSATLRDGTGDTEADWVAAEARTGTRHLPAAAVRAGLRSPFDYGTATRVLIVNDLDRDDADQVAAAYRALFIAAGGGALGLFTAIWRLRQVHERIAGALEESGLGLLAQHVDALDVGTLVDVFRAERHSCLLGTDALRDGVDVPGDALRLIVFDRVPWPRPEILHKARRAAFGGRAYDDMLARLRLKQAFGRLVRRADDYGVFVLLDSAMPTRLLGAFPDGVEVRRVGLAEAVDMTRAFIGSRRAGELTAPPSSA